MFRSQGGKVRVQPPVQLRPDDRVHLEGKLFDETDLANFLAAVKRVLRVGKGNRRPPRTIETRDDSRASNQRHSKPVSAAEPGLDLACHPGTSDLDLQFGHYNTSSALLHSEIATVAAVRQIGVFRLLHFAAPCRVSRLAFAGTAGIE